MFSLKDINDQPDELSRARVLPIIQCIIVSKLFIICFFLRYCVILIICEWVFGIIILYTRYILKITTAFSYALVYRYYGLSEIFSSLYKCNAFFYQMNFFYYILKKEQNTYTLANTINTQFKSVYFLGETNSW